MHKFDFVVESILEKTSETRIEKWQLRINFSYRCSSARSGAHGAHRAIQVASSHPKTSLNSRPNSGSQTSAESPKKNPKSHH